MESQSKRAARTSKTTRRPRLSLIAAASSSVHMARTSIRMRSSTTLPSFGRGDEPTDGIGGVLRGEGGGWTYDWGRTWARVHFYMGKARRHGRFHARRNVV